MDSSNQQQQQNSGLLRFRSAPGSLLDSGSLLMSRFMSSNGDTNNSVSESEFSCQGQQQLPPQYPRQSLSNTSSVIQDSYELMGSLGIDPTRQVQVRTGSASSNLMRQNSSPAGLFSNISVQNGYASFKSMGNFGGINGANGEVCSSPKRLKSQMSLSSGIHSSLGVLSQISEVRDEDVEVNGADDGTSGFPYGSWNDASLFEENVTVPNREQTSDGKFYSGNQDGQLGNGVHMLSHHLSLPKTSSQLVAMENILQFQDSVPCKIRAKRGCATHPRSIAERMRRTRISERMRKLQELVPHMDKQTNTADMLDLAVEYIKDLQKQFKTLSDTRAKCKCLNTEKPISDHASS